MPAYFLPYRALTLPLVLAGALTPTVAQTVQAQPFWLDQSKATNWNKPGSAIPQAPKSGLSESERQRCQATVRAAQTEVDRAVNQAGWLLFGPVQLYGDTVTVRGLSAFDGMCRPTAYQDFVFVKARFAGTLSPMPMTARSDGSSRFIFLNSTVRLAVEFNRYSNKDPLCCPSRTSSVSYRIEQQRGLPVVVPEGIYTSSR